MEFRYRCSLCGCTYEIEPALMLCRECSKAQTDDQPLSGVLDVELSGTVDKDFEVFDLLPVEKKYFPPIPVGNTPLWEPLNLRRELNLKHLFIKDDGLNPTFSFKDRASYLVSAFARKYAINEITLASTGNAGSSMAGVGAAAGQRINLFLPENAPLGKLVQSLQYGARVYRAAGSYDLAYKLALEYSRCCGGMNRSTAYNPMTIEGKKTVSLELFQQLGYRAPDIVFVAVGDACILSGVYRGFEDLLALGLIPTMPKVIGVQSDKSDVVLRALENDGRFSARIATTVADSISVDVPRSGLHALGRVIKHDGELIRVTDEEIIAAQARLSASTGLFAEPAAAAAFAGLLSRAPQLERDAVITVLSTGNGLKDSQSALKGVQMPERLVHTVEDIIDEG